MLLCGASFGLSIQQTQNNFDTSFIKHHMDSTQSSLLLLCHFRSMSCSLHLRVETLTTATDTRRSTMVRSHSFIEQVLCMVKIRCQVYRGLSDILLKPEAKKEVIQSLISCIVFQQRWTVLTTPSLKNQSSEAQPDLNLGSYKPTEKSFL